MNKFSVSTPFGSLIVETENDDSLIAIDFPSKKQRFRSARTPFEREVARQLQQYFSGKRKEFELPLVLKGTEFTQRVLQELWALEYGEVITYSDLALRVGRPKGARAVARVMAHNRLPIVLPCHRIVGRTASSGGYGGGLKLKKALLELEESGSR